MTMRIAAVIVAYNSERVILDLLDSLPAAVGDLDVRTVVVDNGSTDQTVAAVRSRPGVELLERPNLGYAAGVNAGADHVGPEHALLVLNPDLVLAPGCVTALAEAVTTEVGILAPTVRNPDGSLHLSLRREPTIFRTLGLAWTRRADLSEYVTDPEEYKTSHAVDWALGAALLITAPCRAAVGAWDETFFLYSEETDYCLRARDRGLATLFVPRAEVTHIGGASGRSPDTHAMQVVNRVRLYNRRHAGPGRLVFLALTLLREVVWIPRAGRRSAVAVVALVIPWRRPARLGPLPGLLPK